MWGGVIVAAPVWCLNTVAHRVLVALQVGALLQELKLRQQPQQHQQQQQHQQPDIQQAAHATPSQPDNSAAAAAPGRLPWSQLNALRSRLDLKRLPAQLVVGSRCGHVGGARGCFWVLDPWWPVTRTLTPVTISLLLSHCRCCGRIISLQFVCDRQHKTPSNSHAHASLKLSKK